MKPKRIAFLTDTHLGDSTPASYGINARKNLETVLEDISWQRVDSIVFGGDITESSEYKWFFSRLETACPDYKVLLGNHDDFDEAVKHFHHPSEGEKELYYSHEDEGYQYLYLDSSATRLSAAQLAWLEKKLATDKPIVLFVHHPILGFETGMDRIYPLQGRDTINRLLQQCAKPVTVFCGHYHMPDSRTEGNITQYITPAVSFQVNKESSSIAIYNGPFGYRLITISESGITSKLRLF